MRIKISERQKEILKTIGICAILASAIVAPNMVQLLKPFNRHQKYRYKKSIKKLIEKDIIILFGEHVKLTEKGKELLKRIEIEETIITRQEKWDGHWHLVCYDIPEDFKKERDYFRSKLILSGFRIIQDSLLVYPYDCKEEIAVISQKLGISPYVAYLNTDYLPNQNNLLKFFDLNNFNSNIEQVK